MLAKDPKDRGAKKRLLRMAPEFSFAHGKNLRAENANRYLQDDLIAVQA